MGVNEVLELLHAGFSHSEIMAMVNQPGIVPAEAPAEIPAEIPAPAPAAAPAVAPAPAPAPAPALSVEGPAVSEKLSEMMNTILSLKETIQLNNVLNSSQAAQNIKQATAEDAIAQIIRPTFKKKEDI